MADTPITKRTPSVEPKRRAGSTGRLAGRPAALPNARAVLGALLTVAAALLAWFAATNGGETPRRAVVVAARDIAAGAIVSSEDVRVQQLGLPNQLATRVFRLPTEVIGNVSLGPVGAGDPLFLSGIAVTSGPQSARQVSIALPVASAVGGNLRSGDTVDIVAIHDAQSEPNDRSEVLASNVLVSRVLGDNPKLASPTGDRILTFSVDPSFDVEKFYLAYNTAKLFLVRTTGTPPRIANTAGSVSAATTAMAASSTLASTTGTDGVSP